MHFHISSVLVISILSSFVSCEDLDNPKHFKSIIPDKENIMFKANTDYIFVLKCENNEPVIWKCRQYALSKQTSYTTHEDYDYGILLITWGFKSFIANECRCYKQFSKTELISEFLMHEVENIHTLPEGETFNLLCKMINNMDYIRILNVTWLLPKGVPWNKSRMTQSFVNNDRNNLSIQNVKTYDSGNYTCQITYNFLYDEPKRDRQINGTYNMEVKNKHEFMANVNVSNFDNYNFKANTTAYMGVCYHGTSDANDMAKWFDSNGKRILQLGKHKIQQDYVYFSYLRIRNVRLWDSGTYTAIVRHNLKYFQQEFYLTIEDVPIVRMEDYFVLTNEKALIECEVQSHPQAVIYWTFESCSGWRLCSSQPMEIVGNASVSDGSQPLQLIHSLSFEPNSSGIIRCKAVNSLGTAVVESQLIRRDNNYNMTIYGLQADDGIQLGDSVTLVCAAFAYYFSNDINWYSPNGKLIQGTENIFMNNSLSSYYYFKSLTIKAVTNADQGEYVCRARLRNSKNTNSTSKIILINASDNSGSSKTWILGLLCPLIILIALVIYLCIKVKRERKLLYKLKAAGLANFEEGALDQLNPSLTLDEQAELLPYDRRFEFPKDKIKLGMQLGSGAFGVVFKAYAEGIKPDEEKSVVAVKMIKPNACNEHIKALVSELKIMVHLGRHLNVVNLLGAVTKNIAKRELMVIVEYCHYGNIRNFLISNRKRFFNQIDANTGKIDTSIVAKKLLNDFEINRKLYANIYSKFPPDSEVAQKTLYEGEIPETTVMKTTQEDASLTNKYELQDMGSNNQATENTVTTADLISWAFQLASGMEYLSSMNVLHGDLAARNILLCEGYIVKICDFGLARSMYKSDNYKKQGNAILPIKWLALESLRDFVFSTYTDVWSYGIVMWELFSLGTVPYPNVHSYQDLYEKLQNGYRMEKPPYANDDIYSIMLECWNESPESRPLFNILKEKFAKMLGEKVTNHYVVMNEPYLKVNNDQGNLKNYLSLISCPDELAPSLPRHVQCQNPSEKSLSPNSYLRMSSNSKVLNLNTNI